MVQMLTKVSPKSSNGVSDMCCTEEFGFDSDDERELAAAEASKPAMEPATAPREDGKVYIHKVVGGMVVREEKQ